MIRRTRPSLFQANAEETADDADPRVGLVNLADIMLVLAVALMLSVMTHAGIAGANSQQIDESNMEPVEAQDAGTTASEVQDQSGNYEEVGSVYRDKDTGEMYVVTN